MNKDNKRTSFTRPAAWLLAAVVTGALIFAGARMDVREDQRIDAANAQLAKEWSETVGTVANVTTVAGDVVGNAFSRVQLMTTHGEFVWESDGTTRRAVIEVTPEMAVTEGGRMVAWTNGTKVSTASPFEEPASGFFSVIGSLIGCMLAIIIVLTERGMADRINYARGRRTAPSMAYKAI